MSDELVDFRLHYLLGMALAAFSRIDSAPKKEAVRVGVELLKMSGPVAREIAAERAGVEQ
jgi:hypothetical protein